MSDESKDELLDRVKKLEAQLSKLTEMIDRKCTFCKRQLSLGENNLCAHGCGAVFCNACFRDYIPCDTCGSKCYELHLCERCKSP